MDIQSPQQAEDFLISLGAPDRLIRHHQLVGEVTNQVVAALEGFDLKLDGDLVRIGAALHDAGKITHPEELNQSGNLHEAAGETLLLKHSIDPKLARCCRSHAQFQTLDVSLEELLIALADKLWKGNRDEDLELLILDRVAEMKGCDRWTVFSDLDNAWETIASDADQRLARSR